MPIIATLTITLDDAGQVQVNGPISNAVLSYGLLEVAKDLVRAAGQQTGDRIVQPAQFGLVKGS